MKRRRLILTSQLIMILVMSAMVGGCEKVRDVISSGPVARDEFCMDTICSISIYRMENEDGNVMDASRATDEANHAIDDAYLLCSELEDKLSRTREGSDISRINSSKGKWTEVSEEAADLIRLGAEYSEMSGGDFDITIGGVTELWDFHAAEGAASLPDLSELSEAVRHVDYEGIEIEEQRVRIEDPDSKLDTGGIAKGYIGSLMALYLRFSGVESGIINLGGNVICIGGKSDDEDFTIGIETPYSDRSRIVGRISARDMAIATSGVYERKIEVDGKTYHHILDTKTGYPAESDLLSATVIASWEHGADADALSTICLLKGADEAVRLIESMDGFEAVFVLEDGSIRRTSGARFQEE